MSGGSAPAGAPMREARSALEDAEDDLDAAKGALATATATLAEWEDALHRAERRVEAAIGEILAGAIDGVIEQAAALQHQLDGRRAVLRFLAHVSPAGSQAGYRASTTLPTPPPGDAPPGSTNHPVLAQWRAALEALRRDADALLPEAK